MSNNIDAIKRTAGRSYAGTAIASQARTLAASHGPRVGPQVDDFLMVMSRVGAIMRNCVATITQSIKRSPAPCEQPQYKRILLDGKYVSLTEEQAARFEELMRLRSHSDRRTDSKNRFSLSSGTEVSA